jgi:hypothetical protein
MATLLLFAALFLGGASLLFKEAHDEVFTGTPWAADVCSASKLFCSHPEYLGYAAGVALVLAAGAKLGSAMSGR